MLKWDKKCKKNISWNIEKSNKIFLNENYPIILPKKSKSVS